MMQSDQNRRLPWFLMCCANNTVDQRSSAGGLRNTSARIQRYTSGGGPVCPESHCQLACQPLTTSQKVRNSLFSHSPESDYSPSSRLRGLPSSNPPAARLHIPWSWHQRPGRTTGGDCSSELADNHQACLLDTRGVTRVYVCRPNVSPTVGFVLSIDCLLGEGLRAVKYQLIIIIIIIDFPCFFRSCQILEPQIYSFEKGRGAQASSNHHD